MDTLPILDVGPYLAGQDGARERLAEALARACTDVGFYFLVNHGIDQALIDETFEQTRRFHGLPLETKMRIRQDEHYVGYLPPGGIRINAGGGFDNRKNRPDAHEALHVNSDFPPDHPFVQAGRRYYIPQPWLPEDVLPGFRAKVMEYYAATAGLGRRMLPVYATALGAAPDYFDGKFDDALAWLRLIHYPVVDRYEENQFGLGAHTDSGFLTFLPQTDVPGLEVRMPDGEWAQQPVVPGAMLVNAGQILRRWSNDRFRATPHRVISPQGNVDRVSIPMFFNPAADALVECQTGDPAVEAKHAPITYLQHLDWYLANTYKASESADGKQAAAE